MNLVSKHLPEDSRAKFLILLINKVIRTKLPAVTCNYQDLVYKINYDGGELQLEAFELGEGVPLSPKHLWPCGFMVIGRCLPKFIGKKSSEYKEYINIASTDSNSFIWLLDEVVDEKVQEEIQIKSYTPMFTMVFSNIDSEVILSNTLADGLPLLTPSFIQMPLEERLKESVTDVKRIIEESNEETSGLYSINN